MTPQRRPKDAGFDWWAVLMLVKLGAIGIGAVAAIFGAYWLFRVAK